MHNSIASGIDPNVQYEGIAILGSNPVNVNRAPFENKKWLIYACSPHNFEHRRLPRLNAWFEVHVPLADVTRQYPYLRHLEDVPFVWMRDKQAMHLFKNAHAYPEEEMKNKFSPFHFTSSIAFMLAKAVDDAEKLGIKKIGIWGVMQASENEYTFQRPGLQYFIWEAANRGIEVIAPKESKLFHIPKDIW